MKLQRVWKNIKKLHCNETEEMIALSALSYNPEILAELCQRFPDCFTDNPYSLEECGLIDMEKLRTQARKALENHPDYAFSYANKSEAEHYADPIDFVKFYRIWEFDLPRFHPRDDCRHLSGAGLLPQELLVGFTNAPQMEQLFRRRGVGRIAPISDEITKTILDVVDYDENDRKIVLLTGDILFEDRAYRPIQFYPRTARTSLRSLELLLHKDLSIVAIPEELLLEKELVDTALRHLRRKISTTD